KRAELRAAAPAPPRRSSAVAKENATMAVAATTDHSTTHARRILLVSAAPALVRGRRRAEWHAVRQDVGGMLHRGALQQRLFVEYRERSRQHRRGVGARIHADGVLRARFDAEAADDAAELVDLESDR